MIGKKQDEERDRIRRQLEAKISLSESHKNMIIDKERDLYRQKQGYWQKAEQVIKDSQDLQKYHQDLHRSKVDKQKEYQEYLASQVKTKEESFVKGILYIADEEKKVLGSSISGTIGIQRSSPIGTYSPKQTEAKFFGNQPNPQLYQSFEAKPQRYLSQQPGRNNSYNPITNPIPNYGQNPYMKDPLQERASPNRKNFFASLANSNMMN